MMVRSTSLSLFLLIIILAIQKVHHSRKEEEHWQKKWQKVNRGEQVHSKTWCNSIKIFLRAFSEFSWFVFSRVRTECGEIRSTKYKDQKNYEYQHFSRSILSAIYFCISKYHKALILLQRATIKTRPWNYLSIWGSYITIYSQL